MAATLTISGVIDTGISITLPTTITSGATVQSSGAAAVFGGPGTLINSGKIDGDIFGVSLAQGGVLTNTSGGEIYGFSGVEILGSSTVDNAGVISGGAIGVILGTAALTNEVSGTIAGGIELSSGTLTNKGLVGNALGDIVAFSQGGTVLNLGASANLTGGDVVGVAIAGGLGRVLNQGSISGVSMLDGGAVTNAGYIQTGSGSFGVSIANGSGYVENSGHIVGVALSTGLVVNTAGGTVSGYLDGIDLSAGGTINNAGAILGIGGRFSAVRPGRDGISLTGSGTIINDAGAVINGSNDGIALSGTGSGSVTIINHGTIIGQKGIVVDSSLNTTIVDYGVLAGTGGTAVAFESGNDTLVLEAGAVVQGLVVGGSGQDVTLTIDGSLPGNSGGIELYSGASLLIEGSMASAQTISFAGTDATLMIGDASHFWSQINGMTPNDTIDLTQMTFGTGAHAFLTTNNVVEILGGDVSMSLQLDPVQYYGGEFFHISSDGLNGTDVTESAVPCFLTDTQITTAGGDVAVQNLKLGDMVMTGAGALRPVKWIGRRSYKMPLPNDPDVIPVRIKAGALAADVPRADLYISPRHAVRVDGALVPAGALINGVSVLSCPDVTEISYFHVEMDSHDTILANGAEAETFIDHDSRKMFDNADEFYRLYPQDWNAGFVLCAPRLEYGPELEAVRRRVAFRAGLLPAQRPDSPVIGFLEHADRQTFTGWAFAPAKPNVPVSLDIFNRGALLARTVANMPRPDVKSAGFGHGRCGFSITLPAPLPALLRHEISVRPAGAEVALNGAPIVIDPGIAHDLLKSGGLKSLIDAAVQGLGSCQEVADLGSSLEAAGRHIRLSAAAPRRNRKMPAANMHGPRALLLDSFWPTVTRDAGSNAIISHVEAFQRLGYQVAFCAVTGAPADDDAAAGLDALRELGVDCHGQDGATAEASLRRLAAHGLDVVYLHRLAVASAYGGMVRQHAPAAKVIYAVADLHHLRLTRQAAACDRPDLAAKARSVKAAELWAMQLADCVLTHSRFEAAYLRQEAPRANVHVVPWAVRTRPPLNTGRRQDVAFIGGAGHAPNLDAVIHLARDIMPLVWAADPSVRCLVAGTGWTGNLFNGFDPRMVALGQQPDLAPLLRGVRLTVAPLRFGAGIKGKVLESMAAGTACVMSEIAAEGLPLDTNLRGVVGDGAAVARNILAVSKNKKLGRILVQSGLDMLATEFSEQAVVAALAQALGHRDVVGGTVQDGDRQTPRQDASFSSSSPRGFRPAGRLPSMRPRPARVSAIHPPTRDSVPIHAR